MKKGQVAEGYIERVEFPDKAILRVEGEDKKVVVKGGICGQKVRVLITKVRKEKGEGRFVAVLERAPVETEEPVCPHFGICGGCSLQTLSYQAQLERKEEQVRRLLDEVCPSYLFEGISASPVAWGYRNKMEFSFGDEYKEGPLVLGLHKKGSFYDLVTVRDCRITDRDYNQILICVWEHFKELGTAYYKKMQHTGILRHLLIRKAKKTGDILIDLVTASHAYPEMAGITKENLESLYEELKLSLLTKRLLGLSLEGEIKGILHTINDSLADVVRNDKTVVLYGQAFFYEELLGLRFKINPFSFFQTNSLGAEILYDVTRRYVGETKDKVIFDLYSGTGTIAQILAPVAKKVIGVEIVEEAVEAARENAAANGLSNCKFIAGDVLKVVEKLEEKPDFVVLDPPRDGVHHKALEKIAGTIQAEKIIYVSCKPTSLVRDLVVLQEYGYRVERVCCVDMFPQTDGVETVVCLGREFDKSKEYVCLNYEASPDIEVTCAVTYTEIKEWVMKEYGLKVSSLYVAHVKQKHGIIERENYNKPRTEGGKVPHCPPEKEAAIEAALRYFRMI